MSKETCVYSCPDLRILTNKQLQGYRNLYWLRSTMTWERECPYWTGGISQQTQGTLEAVARRGGKGAYISVCTFQGWKSLVGASKLPRS